MIKQLGAGISGGANYVKLPLVAGQTDAASFSYEFWMSERSRTSYCPVVCNQTTEEVLDACWGQTSGGTRQYVKGFSGNLLNAWHHVAVVVDRTANTASFHVDGVQKASSPAGSITASSAFNSGLQRQRGRIRHHRRTEPGRRTVSSIAPQRLHPCRPQVHGLGHQRIRRRCGHGRADRHGLVRRTRGHH
ncbi:MAG: LamG-like jellyroll fold domain-containing protein [Specibacter sp.]